MPSPQLLFALFLCFFFRKMVSCHVTTGKMRKLKNIEILLEARKYARFAKSRGTHTTKKREKLYATQRLNEYRHSWSYGLFRYPKHVIAFEQEKRRRKKETVRLNNRKIENQVWERKIALAKCSIENQTEGNWNEVSSFFFSTFTRNIYRHSLINGKTYYFLIASYRFVFGMRIIGWIYFWVYFFFHRLKKVWKNEIEMFIESNVIETKKKNLSEKVITEFTLTRLL